MRDVFSARFKQARERARLTQDEVATACRNRAGEVMNGASIAQWEKPDGTRPTFENLIAAARRLNTSIDYLTGLTDLPNEVREESANYGFSDESMYIASRWAQLPTPAKDAVRNLIEAILKTTIK